MTATMADLKPGTRVRHIGGDSGTIRVADGVTEFRPDDWFGDIEVSPEGPFRPAELEIVAKGREDAMTGIESVNERPQPTLAEPHPERYSYEAAVNGDYPALCGDQDCGPCKATAAAWDAEDEAADRAWKGAQK